MKIDLSGLFKALAPILAPAAATKIADQVLGVDRGSAVIASVGVTPTTISPDEAKAIAQPLVDTALVATKSGLETVLDKFIVKYVPATLQAQAIAELNADVDALKITL